ncbi:hypothetical protein [uncultured Gammaproteobacteria bacterium]|jgi:hypothetical protein|nr:hypothetical protein [uncultured Gammaproteobacteria bacterium]CAC9559727.1 hypothetical protein [uncultured Gammaproteobacteria bacterium]CAC9564402.1 hypothetical protein [uncultured Gammaproteobacteria bacterium]CAC9568804.1 hypothetical protein [uncultured Gammaproteobacteria bacterium]CAC9961957.1 hypothetical protein [uncultured Gammaproteobacteria bacterium]
MNEIYNILSWEWSKIIQSVASIITVVFAYRALTIWKLKAQANKKTEFIDVLIDEVHKFTTLVQPAIKDYKVIKMSVDNHNRIDKLVNNNPPLPYKTYITEAGAQDSDRLSTKLKECVNTMSKIRSLVVKGQIYDFIDYDKCQEASNLILHQYNRLAKVVFMINPGLFLENPKVQESLFAALSQEPEDMENCLKEQNIKLLKFARKNYVKIYKNT